MAKKSGTVNRRRYLPVEMPLLVGRLQVGGPPLGLLIDVWCPFCKRMHNHGWLPDQRRADHVEHRVAHCDFDSPAYDRGYYIGLDPAASKENTEAFAAFDRVVAARRRRAEHCAKSS